MQRLTIGRTLRLALVGIALALATIAALGIGSLFESRQRYEDRVEETYALEAAGARLEAAGIVEEATLLGSAQDAPAARERAAANFDAEAARASALADDDARSEVLVRRRIAAQRQLRDAVETRPGSRRGRDRLAESVLAARGLSTELSARQAKRRAEAREQARSDTRRAVIVSALAGALALGASITLVVALLSAIRSPLEELVEATASLAAGDLSRRVNPSGPRELRGLGEAFNTMAGELDHARERVEQERRRLEITVESLGDALLVCGETGRVDAVNPRARELVPELVPGADATGADSPLPAIGEALAGEVVVERAGRSLAVTAAELEDGAGFVWTVRDISERTRLERLKTEFVATASHELRSPLTSIKGFAELLSASRGLTRKQREFVGVIELSTNRLVDLVNDLLDVARIEAGRMEIHARPTALGDVVREVAELLAPTLDEKHQRLNLEIPAPLPPAQADPARMRQVMTNLLTNAHLYSGEGSEISVTLADTGETLSVRVADTGRGMSAEAIECVFDRFYRAPDTDDASSGSGLGLAIVKSLVDLHGGTIEVESTPGEGTVFELLIPRAPAPGMPSPRERLGGARVLVIDDEPEIAALIVEQLQPFGVEAEVAGSGSEGIERLEREHFDAVTLDILMPGMSGFEVLEALRGNGRASSTPVVVVSVLSGHEALAGEWTVTKPIQPLELADALGAALTAGRTRVLVVGRSSVRPRLAPLLERAGLEHEWVGSASAAARRCREERFEVALVDAGMHSPQAALRALALRGRRPGRAVVVFSSGDEDERPALAELEADPVPIERAAQAVVAVLGRSS